ncbi:MAG TPA: hypothetical protein VK550_12410 [Polyangiaceae bacterium]|nr:hypothetical protein [Polyangiaceae bacterium]
MATVQLYCNPATSEVTGEYPTLHEAIAAASPSAPAGALLMSDGVHLATVVLLATAVAPRWLFEQAGIERLHNEFNAIIGPSCGGGGP